VSPAEALLVAPDDAPALARAIVAVRDDPAAAARRASAARARLAAEFAPEPWIDRYAALYQSLIA
jgi:glycosyltransferase involved in cell wall biosynthesis